tara:strand:- start:69321 stop:69542 length:222 start_codon:yes stop_codon:yes gene_type:complete
MLKTFFFKGANQPFFLFILTLKNYIMTKSEEFYTKMFLQDEMEKEQFRFFHGDVVRLDKLPLEVEIYFDKFGT